MRKLLLLFSLISSGNLFAQDNYEIQVYGSPTQDKGSTIFELHSNFTFSGEKSVIDGVRPTYHALHETVEITQGISDNFEIGFEREKIIDKENNCGKWQKTGVVKITKNEIFIESFTEQEKFL